MRKKIFCAILFFAIILAATPVLALEVLFEHRELQEVTRGVTYERNRMMTPRGLLDVHVLFVDVNQPFITLAPVAGSEMGLRETTTRMLSDAGAVAGINADFFSMTRNHSPYYGPMVRDGNVLSLNAFTNSTSNDLATFFLDSNYNPFFKYMRTTMQIYSNNVFLFNILHYNSTGATLYRPMIVSRAAMDNTATVARRFPDATKIVVENEHVTYVSFPGATVNTPQNGFVIVVPAGNIAHYRRRLAPGTHIRFSVRTSLNVNFSEINAAIGGGAIILRNGELIAGSGVQPNARHPRTAVGATPDGRVLLVAVDGRSHSIGVTHAELGAILRRYGVVNAMHMDGGGSTTLVTRAADGTYSTRNTVSDGSQRRVTNALGVFNNAPVGAKTGIVIEPAENRAIQGVPMPANVFGTDAWGNRIPLGNSGDEPVFTSDRTVGFWYDGRYTPLRTGQHVLRVSYGGFTAYTEITAFSLGELQPRNESISLIEGGRARLRFSGTATDGTQVNIPEVTGLTVTPAYLGTFENGYFIAEQGGSGFIAAMVGGIRAYISVTVSGFPRVLNMLGGTVGYLNQPSGYVTTRFTTDAANGRIRMDYEFSRTTETQAANVTFTPALEIPGTPIALRLRVYGDNSGHWLRGRVRDGNGDLHNIDFTREINFTGWETLTARLPDVPAPFTIDRIYTVVTESFETQRNSVTFYGLSALYAPPQPVAIPTGTVFQDRLRAGADFVAPHGSATHNFSVPRGDTSFEIIGVSNIAVGRIDASGGGIRAADANQWRDMIPTIRALNTPHVVILMNANPLTFSQRQESELFHAAMTMLRDQGRNVFVVSATAGETTLTMRDNIRYINLARPESGNASIRFYTEGNRIWWTD